MNIEGEKKARLRKFIKPAFHYEKLKVMFCAITYLTIIINPSYFMVTKTYSPWKPNNQKSRMFNFFSFFIIEKLQNVVTATYLSCNEIMREAKFG